MNFEEFHKMLRELYTQASEELPEFSIIKELFEHIDVRHDGLLDFQEFTQNFRNCKPPSLLMGTIPIK
jgi:Ca2+-binding EF-hand superfamily protein